jgi:hypothetical protein
MVDLNSILGKSEEKAPEAVAPVVVAPAEKTPVAQAPVVAAAVAAAPVAAAPAGEKPAVGSGWEVAPGIWQIVVPVTGAFTLPDGRWVRPTEQDGVSRAAVPVEWIEYVKDLGK